MDNVQNGDSFITVPSSQTYRTSHSEAQTMIRIFYSEVSVDERIAAGLRPPARTRTGRKDVISL
jgi:hypothetical protein